MTVAPQRPPARFDDLAGALAVLRQTGHRVSTARRLILAALFAADGPVSAEHIADGLGGRLTPLDVASTYRNLETLEALGLVCHVHLGHAAGLYALAAGGEREYLVCERCGALRTVAAAQLEPVRAQIRRQFGYHAHFGHFPIVGLCAACAARPISTLPRPTDSDRGGDMPSDEHRHDAPHAHEHSHDAPHAHEHSHGDQSHGHAHTTHDHDHTEHEHEHSHGDRAHSHPHVHEQGLEDVHEHDHEQAHD